MSVEAPPAGQVEPELHLLVNWAEPEERSRPLWAVCGSILFHAGVFLFAIWLASLPPPAASPSVPGTDLHQLVILVTPRDIIHQPTPADKTPPELTLEDLMARRPKKQGTRQPNRAAAPAPSPPPAPPVLPQPPQTKMPQAPPPALGNIPLPAVQPPPPNPQPQPKAADEQPKLAFETPGIESGTVKGTGRIQVPKLSVDEAVQNLAHPSGSGSTSERPGGGLTPGQSGYQSLPQMLSDPLGVDFRPYLARVVLVLRRNWLSIAPDAARRGSRGVVVLQFVIMKDGSVGDRRLVTASGVEAFDRAAFMALSASNPFPPLPPEFHGAEIRLQATLSYNLANR